MTKRRGAAKLLTQYCVGCKSRKPIKGFRVGPGLCAECASGRAQAQKASGAKAPGKPSPTSKPAANSDVPKSWKCPRCLRRVDVNGAGTALVQHRNGRGQSCAGSGHQLPQKSTDALDYRVTGSFEGGRRRT